MRKTHAADLFATIAVLTIAAIGEIRYMLARTPAQRLQVAFATERSIARFKMGK